MNVNQGGHDNLRTIGKQFEDYRRINLNKIKLGYPKELRDRVLSLLKNGVEKNELTKVTKVAPATLGAWISKREEESTNLAPAKELKIITDIDKCISENREFSNSYCAKININNGISIDLTEHGLLLILNNLCGIK